MQQGIENGEYFVVYRQHTFHMKLEDKWGEKVLYVISSSKWFKQTGFRWSGFATYYPPDRIKVWDKFRGTKKRNRPWDALAVAFYEQVIQPTLEKCHQSQQSRA